MPLRTEYKLDELDSIIFLIFILNIADIITTYHGLKLGYSELNPFVAWNFKTFGFIETFYIKFISVFMICIMWYFYRFKKYWVDAVSLAIVYLLYVVVVCCNLFNILKAVYVGG